MNNWWLDPVADLATDAQKKAEQRQAQLTKPPGSLGRLEQLAVRFAGFQNTPLPVMDKCRVLVFAADHGIAGAGVSVYPQAVTGEMVRNFAHGGAAINVLARHADAEMKVIDVGTIASDADAPGVIRKRVGHGTANFLETAAMSDEQAREAMDIGRHEAVQAAADGVQLLIGGEMGIGNTTAATAIACALLGQAAEHLTGPGTGLDTEGISRKASAIERALDLHQADTALPFDILCRLGGFEIAALTGYYLAAAQQGVPVLIDGYIASAAALLSTRLNPAAGDWMIFAHRSAEPGHRQVLAELSAEPLLDLGMRLGEGSGAALALPLIRQSLALHREMATFGEADISGPSS